MDSSDDEADALLLLVSNYEFQNDIKEPVSFSIMPVLWDEGNRDDNKEEVFLGGSVDNGLQKIHHQVTAWKFDLSNVDPEISVLSKDNKWYKLVKPRKRFEEIVRTILITVQCLHIVKRNPEISERSLWDNLSRVFCSFEGRPCQNDLVDHIPLICEAVKRDNTLRKSKFLEEFIAERPGKRKLPDEDVQPSTLSDFIVDDVDDMDYEEDGAGDSEDLYDSVCAICDNGGDLLCCDGKCLRCFHATVESGEDSLCDSLGFTKDQVEKTEKFYCKNCQYKRHQCFACGKLGSSDEKSSPEVFLCSAGTCCYYYHSHCVAKLLNRGNEDAAEELRKSIAAGGSFTCPVHRCYICNAGENRKEFELQFAVCRRCPKSYHRKCLPKKIAFEDRPEESIIQRAWEDLLPNRVLIYCLNHKIDEELGTPARDHIKFPGEDNTVDVRKMKKQASKHLASRDICRPNKRSLETEGSFQGRSAVRTVKRVKQTFPAGREGEIWKKGEKLSSDLDSSRKLKQIDESRSSFKNRAKSGLVDANKPSLPGKGQTSLGGKLYALMIDEESGNDLDKSVITKEAADKSSSIGTTLDSDSERRILALMKESASSINLKDVMEKHVVPSTHASYWLKNVVDKSITMGKVERAVESVRTALQKLEEGCSIEDAQIVCEPEILIQIMKWKNKLKVYLAPFLHGMRYTSFGRHFTKVEKLEEIVDKLHLYVNNGDMLVDFCCGANDFSCLMQKKLDETGKKCFYKNYDFIHPKNDFNFEKRDWMTVQPKELPSGSQLIMGLNPPFGVKASLANKFIDKALEFKPKLIILIVPPETERLDKKKSPYDLIWEDSEFLSGKSFYLPGSVDGNDKQIEQWNLKPPPLYLWSRRDWTIKHKDIAKTHGHLRKEKGASYEVSSRGTYMPDHPLEDHSSFKDIYLSAEFPVQNEKPEELGSREGHKENSGHNNGDREIHETLGHLKNESRKTSDKQKHGREVDSSEDNQTEGVTPTREVHKGISHGSVHSVIDERCHPSRSHGMPTQIVDGNDRHGHFEGSDCTSHILPGPAYGGSQANIPDEMTMRYGMTSNEPYASGTPRWSSLVSPSPEYGVRRMDGRYSAQLRESADALRSRSYISEFEENYARESELRSQVRFYGQNPDYVPENSNYSVGHNTRYDQLGSMSGTYELAGSTMQRYAPRLDELNPMRMSNLGPEQPMMGHDRRPPGASYSMGFAPGPQHPYPHQNSSGWLDE